MTEGNWTDWHKLHQSKLLGAPEPPGAEYVSTTPGFVAGRLPLSVEEAREWLQRCLLEQRAPAAGLLPAARADLTRPQVPIRVMQRSETAAGAHVGRAVRPATGFLLSNAEPSCPLDPEPDYWNVGDKTFIAVPLSLGLFWPRIGVSPLDAAPGLFVGRLERRAWINGISGGASLETFDVYIGLEQDRIDVSDLEVTLEEWVGGELAYSRRLRLEEASVDQVRGAESFVVRLPTLGSRVQRAVSLNDRDGRLLDASKRAPIVENLSIVVVPEGMTSHRTTELTVGHRSAIPDLVERAADLERVEQQYRQLLEEGAEDLVVAPSRDAGSVLAQRLTQARGRLDIIDRYFGQEMDDWKLLTGVQLPKRVLTSKGKPPPAMALLEVRQVRRVNGQPPFHERIYLWDGGGLSVGHSPNGFSKADVTVRGLSGALCHLWEERWNDWWSTAKILVQQT